MSIDRALIQAAAHLSHRAPPEWADFVKAFSDYVDGKRDELVAANTDALAVSQGRAQACVSLRKLFTECRDMASRIENRKPSQPR